MTLTYMKEHRYRPITNTQIKTDNSMIYKAQDLELNRNVCIKSIKIEGKNPRQVQANLQSSMLEVRTMVEVSDQLIYIPSIFSTYFDESTSMLYIIMQWIEGASLEEKMKTPPLQFIQWMIKLCDILTVMERRNLYHKDIKPANIMIDAKNELFLIDFNISVSAPNMIEGTPHYKAPEMDKDSKYMSREKVDMFAIGVILYEYYTGQVPKRTIEYAKNRRRGKFAWDVFTQPIEKNPQMPKLINEIIINCMKLDPKERYHNSAALKRDLVKAERSVRYDPARPESDGSGRNFF